MGNKVGGAKEAVRDLLAKTDKLLDKLVERNKKKDAKIPDVGAWNNESTPGRPDCG